MPWGDKSVSPCSLTLELIDSASVAADNNAILTSAGIAHVLFCPHMRPALYVELRPELYSLGTLLNAPDLHALYGMDFFQATSDKRPLFSRDANGRPFLRFDGANDSLTTTTVPSPLSMQYYVAFKWNHAITTTHESIISSSSANQILIDSYSTNMWSNPSTVRVNGVSGYSLVPNGKNIISGVATSAAEALCLGALSGASRFFMADLYALLLFRDGSHDLATKQKIEGWLDDITGFGVIA